MPGPCVYSAVFSHDGSMELTACKDHTARIWNVSTGGTDDEVTACLPFLFACLACLPCSLASLLKQVLFVTMCS